ncbi:MAG: hypothetical protein II885_12305 [Oscillospiraceae bacterium]|nr:hypothetical protein [Oscillospiraceae bacterium]
MNRRIPYRPDVLFVMGFVLAGTLHVLDRLLIRSLLPAEAFSVSALRAFGSTTLFVLNLSVYLFLLFWWLLSVRQRLLPSRGRSYILLAAGFMLFFLLERAVKYRLAEDGSLLEHICWYAYYIPLAMIPALFLLTCMSMQKPRGNRTLPRRLVWGSAFMLIALVVTNDLHRLMFRPVGDLKLGGAAGTYEIGPLWFVFYVFLGACILLGLAILAQTDREGGRRTFLPALLLLLTFVLMYVFDGITNRFGLPSPYYFPEIFIFGMLGIFESCIRSRLIPYNENYPGFFARMELAAEITDAAFTPVYATAKPLRATPEQRGAALIEPLLLDEDTRLYGKPLSAGYAFWTGDEGVIRRLNDSLEDAAEVLESENDLLEFENRQKEARARVDARNQVYAKAAEAVYGTQKRIAALLDGLRPDAPDYRDRLARVLALNAYVKRRTNLALLSVERDTVTAEELALALEESARFLSLCGMSASVERKTELVFSNAEAVALYDSFEALAELLSERSPALLITLADGALRLMAECAPPDSLSETPGAVEMYAEDGQLYLTVTAGKGGGA